MTYEIEFISTSYPGTNKRRNLEKRAKAGRYLVENGFPKVNVPTVADVENEQRRYRGKGLKDTSLYGDHFVIARNDEGKIVGAARFDCSDTIIEASLGLEALGVAQNHLNKAVLKQVFVNPAERHNGLGGQLVKKTLEEAKRLGFTQMYGYAENDSPQLTGFYEALGFSIEEGDQPDSIFGDFPVEIANARTGGVFFQQSLEDEDGRSSQKAAAILQGDGVENTRVLEQPSVTDVENRNPESRPIPTGYGQEEGVMGRRGILDRIRGFSTETLYRIGNIGLILVQALLFLVTNFFANFSGWWVDRSVLGAMGISLGYVVPFSVFLSMYYASVSGQEKEPPRWIMGLVAVAIVAVLPAGVERFATSGVVDSLWWKGVKLAIGTACQGVAGYIAWKAVDLIPTPTAKKNSNEDGEE